MRFLVEAQYGYYNSNDQYFGPVIDKIEVEADNHADAENLAWQQVQSENGTDQLFEQDVLTVIEL